AHFDQAMALYEPAEHRPLSSRFDNMPRQPPTPNSLSLLPRKNVPVWKARGMMNQGSVLALTGRALAAIGMLASGIAALRLMTPLICNWHITSGWLASILRDSPCCSWACHVATPAGRASCGTGEDRQVITGHAILPH